MRADLRAPAVNARDTTAEALARWAFNHDIVDPELERSQGEPIVLPSGSVSFSDAAEKLFARLATTGTIFLRSDHVVELQSRSDGIALSVVSAHALRTRVERFCKLQAWRSGPNGQALMRIDARLSLDAAKVFLEATQRRQLPEINAIVAAPVLMKHAEGGASILAPGFDQASGILVTGGALPVAMSLTEALKAISLLFEEFEFATEADRSRAVAVLLSPALQFGGLLRCHYPLFIIEADESQSGKGYMLEVGQKVYRESPSVVAQKRGGVGSFDESLAQAMVAARPFIQLDNIRGKVSSTFLEAVLTCPLGTTVPARIPNRGTIQVDPSRHIFQLTSNGFASTRDLANRACIVRIRKRCGYAFRQFAEGSLAEHVKANQAYYLAATHAIARAWVEAECPKTNDLRGEGRFRPWCQALDWIVQKLCGLPALMDGHELAQERACDPGLTWVRHVTLVVEEAELFGTPLSAGELIDHSDSAGVKIPGAPISSDEKSRKMIVGKILGRLFKRSDPVVLDEFIITRSERMEPRQDGTGSIKLRTYVFERQ